VVWTGRNTSEGGYSKKEFSQEKALANAPERENGFFVVPKILEL
jgi:Asp-tRNA(Asn)/Glu-tRNA(Gln) amidotransferase C subunit